MEANKNKMYLTSAEAEALNLPTMEEQIERWNRIQAEIRKDASKDGKK